jgi:fatty acid desaturase
MDAAETRPRGSDGDSMAGEPAVTAGKSEHNPIGWYRTPIPRDTLQALNCRSDARGLVQAGGYLAVLCCTGAATLWSAFSGHYLLTLPLLFLHGMCGSFSINAVHELSHQTVFKSRWLNELFVRIFGFIGWNDWVWFKASHTNHHRYTLHPPRDGEVVLPITWVSRKTFLQTGIWAPLALYRLYTSALQRARGKLADAWSLSLFPDNRPDTRRPLIRWNRGVLIGHSLILLSSVTAALLTRGWAWLLVPYVVSFSTTYGGWLFYLCNNTQHVGLTDQVPDFRLCCRSMRLPSIVSFLYWHMEYHTEHHMFAAVPCYNLHRLNRAIAHDLPPPKGMIGTWREIAAILRRQATEPGYQYRHPLPEKCAMQTAANKALHATSEPAPGAASSSHES